MDYVGGSAFVFDDFGDFGCEDGKSAEPHDKQEQIRHENGPVIVDATTFFADCHEPVDHEDQGC